LSRKALARAGGGWPRQVVVAVFLVAEGDAAEDAVFLDMRSRLGIVALGLLSN